MRYWGKNIQIDGSFYRTDMGKKLLPTPTEMAQLRASGNFHQYEGDVEVYEITVQNMLRDIQKNDVGGILVEALNSSSRTLRIIPLTSKEQSQTGRVPSAIPVGHYNPHGNDCVIWFEPWSRMANLFSRRGSSPYQVLVHELQHALREMRGKFRYIPIDISARLSGPSAFPNAEELFSVMLENMFMSAAGQPQNMLGAYHQNTPLNNRTDKDFYKQYGNEIEIWCKDLPDMTTRLQQLYGIWNPIRVRGSVLNFATTL